MKQSNMVIIAVAVTAFSLFSACARSHSGYIRFGEDGYGRVAGGKISFYAHRASWIDMPEAEFDTPRGTERVFTFGFQGLGLVRGDEAQFYAYKNGWAEIPGSRMALPKGWDDICGMGGASLAVKVGKDVHLHWLTEGAWKEIVPAGISLEKDVDDMLGFGFESLAFRTGRELELLSWNGSEGWVSHAEAAFALPETWTACFEFGPDGLGVEEGKRLRFFRINLSEWREATALERSR